MYSTFNLAFKVEFNVEFEYSVVGDYEKIGQKSRQVQK
jgi:hypothetical protein